MENYLGAKNGSGVYQAIINLIPPHETYIEPFLGTGGVFWRKPPAINNIGIDLNAECVSQSTIDKHNYAAAIKLINGSAFSFLKNTDFSSLGRTVVYCDPPYLLSTRTSKARYQHELTDQEHKELLSLLCDLPCYVMLSGYRSPLYERELEGWWSTDFQAMSRGGVRTETVWCNFEPSEIHYHTYAGVNFTDRQRIQRKAQRWARNFEAMPPGERQAVLSALLAV